ncbi:MAG: hypothetical protein C5B53_08555 [Candidatus Melainabacteria bacterium]|nr:MAG: hypothetical protein C5B53_08555 [Candidatus Melainabacteria bacterium]
MIEKCSVGIVGGGPMGLFCALALTSKTMGRPTLRGERVAIFDPGDPRKTAGMSASAFVDFDWTTSNRRLIRWQENSRDFYRAMLAMPGTALQYGPIYVFRREARVLEPGERHLAAHELPTGFPHGTWAETFRINPPVFLEWMRAELKRRGVRFVPLQVDNFAQVNGECGAKVIVNASGVGAQALCDDPQVFPVRGHCAVVRLRNAPQEVRLVAREQTWYVASGPDECRVGGSSEENCWDLDPDPTAVKAMFQRLRPILPPEFDPDANQLAVSCGLRPGRHGGERLEAENQGNFEVVHCYGSRGDGFTRGPGCAVEVRELVLARVTLD